MLFLERFKTNLGLLIILIFLAISLGGLVEIIPLMNQSVAVEPAPGVRPFSALELAGRDVYVREGCYGCHSQQIRMLYMDTARYGDYSVAGESVYDRPFLWGSKRTGPELARIGGRYSDDWHRQHLNRPQDVVPGSNMPAYPWLEEAQLDGERVKASMRALQRLGDPYSNEDINDASAAVAGRTEMDALITYLQVLGTMREGS